VVPALWPLEVANTLVVGERRKRSTPAQAATWLSLLEAFPITVDAETAAHAWVETLALARAQDLSAYDAAYLELAMRRGLPLATLDEKLKKAATAVGVGLYTA
jgi:predicted nucleic acid-binding protein